MRQDESQRVKASILEMYFPYASTSKVSDSQIINGILETIKEVLFCEWSFFFFSYVDILKIDNLWCFTSLTKLQLDNNIIEKIEGLDMLVNLVWLGKIIFPSIIRLC